MVQIVEIRSKKTGNKKSKNKGSKPTTQVVVIPGRKRPSTAKRSRQGNRGPQALADVRVSNWDRLLRDPCGAQLAHPCYTGCDSGYLIRVSDFITPSNTNPGAASVGSVLFSDFTLQWTPYNLATNSGYIYATSNSVTPLQNGFANFVSNSGTVKRYRPVASCLKWIPSGAYSTRAGVVGAGYSPGQVILSSDTSVVAQPMLATCQLVVPNGSRAHEVRWLPTEVDETFTTQLAGNNSGAGSVFMVLKGVDGIVTAANVVTMNGYFEMTTTYEWIPNQLNSVTVAPRAPLPYTSQQLLSTIMDMGSYLFDGVRMGSGRALRTAGFMMGAAATQSILTGGVRPNSRRMGYNIGS